VFARRTAPVQVTWLGYCNTTGVPAMDYRLTDGEADPPGAESQCTETLVRLPNAFLCYTPPSSAPPVAAAPVLANGCVTFGSFNDLAKINDEVVALWADILGAVDGSRIYLKTKALFDSEVREQVHQRFERHGVARNRVLLSGWVQDVGAHLAQYGQVDIGLDTFPYCGTTTTCEALWMGVPVVTLAGARHAGRVGVSINTCVGLREFVAGTRDEYLASARSLAADPKRLRALRVGLRPAMESSALCDGAAFTRGLEAAYRDMWHGACRRYGRTAEAAQ
jgi:predicted O-linked N-acetylglucosamine transferase (SPINDLY family)